MRERSAQAAALLILTALAAGAAVAGPWYVESAGRAAAAADVANAPVDQRLLSVRQVAAVGTAPQAALDGFRAAVRRGLTLPERDPTLGVAVDTYAFGTDRFTSGPAVFATPVAYRDDLCGHVRVAGRCPAAPMEAVVSEAAAETLGLSIGDTIPIRRAISSADLLLTVVGRYERIDPAGAYWAEPLFAPPVAAGTDDRRDPEQFVPDPIDPVFVSLDSFAASQLAEPTFVYNTSVPDRLLRGDDGVDLRAELARTDFRFSGTGLHLVDPTRDLLDDIARDRATLRDGVLVGIAEILLLSWFAVVIACRYGITDRRHDVALYKLRGATGPNLLRPLVRQSLPVAGGAVLGAAVGYLLAGAPSTGTARAALTSAAVLGVALLGILAALVATELTALRAPVAALLRQAPPARGRGRRWRTGVLDLVLLLVAVAAVYQARAAGPGQGLAPLAPTLAALALAVLSARALGLFAGQVAGSALGAGRLRPALIAVHLGRRPGTDRLFAFLLVAVAVLASADGWAVGYAARGDRAEQSLGAPRVLTVHAAGRAALLAAVHTADPTGREAMAAVLYRVPGTLPVLAVDTPRLAAVATWRAGYGPRGAMIAAITPPAQPTVEVTGTDLVLRVRNDRPVPVRLTAQVENAVSGALVPVVFGPVGQGEREVSAAVPDCARPGCRLVSLTLAGADGTQPAAGAAVTVTGIAQRGPDRTLLDAAGLGDVRRWRGSVAGRALSISARDGGLTLTLTPVARPAPQDPQAGPGQRQGARPVIRQDPQAFVADAPLPVPAVLAGPLPATWAAADASFSPFGGPSVPARVAARTAVLPVLGRSGVLVDLTAAQRVTAGAGSGGTFQVWLAGGASRTVPDRLRAAGLTVLADETRGGLRDRLGAHGPAAAAWFRLLIAVVGLLIGGAALAVAAAAERRPQVADLRSLRVQGLTAAAARRIGYGGPAALVALAIGGGLLVSVVARLLAGTRAVVFADAWAVLPPPAGPHLWWLLAAGLGGSVVLGLSCWLAVRPLAREVGR